MQPRSVIVKQELTVDDALIAAELVGALFEHVKVDPETIEKARNDAGAKRELGIKLMQAAVKIAPQEAKRFAASVCSLTPDEFGQLPMRAILEVAEQLAKKPDIENFFARASELGSLFGIAGQPKPNSPAESSDGGPASSSPSPGASGG